MGYASLQECCTPLPIQIWGEKELQGSGWGGGGSSAEEERTPREEETIG